MAWVRRELDTLGIPPLRRFGQHFLVDKIVRDQLVKQAELKEHDTVVEVGPGLGFLTAALTAKAGRVIAIEKDRTLAKYLQNRFLTHRNLTVVQGDALTFQIPEQAKIVSSPPYNISSKLVLLILKSPFKLASLLLQNEFARRLIAVSGSPDYGRLTVMLQSRAHAELHVTVPRTAFYPQPRVNSALVTISPLAEAPKIRNETLFAEMVRVLFTQRRKRLRGVLTKYLILRFPEDWKQMLDRTTIPEKCVFEASIQELVALSNQIATASADYGSKRDQRVD